jgi:hypothetical protein
MNGVFAALFLLIAKEVCRFLGGRPVAFQVVREGTAPVPFDRAHPRLKVERNNGS